MDKKISELSLITSIDSADVSILVHQNTDYQFNFDTLLSFLSNNLATGAAVTFGTTLPQNNTGKNGDLFINTASGAFAQKISGTWVIVFTSASYSQADGTILYGLGAPNSSTGKDNDTYINTGNGTFYKKDSGTWTQVFSMLNGPAGAKGNQGDQGNSGADGKTILNGTADPSNQTTGTDGDFYINTNTWNLFGPKTAGEWGSGILIKQTQSTVNLKTTFTNLSDPVTINWQTDDDSAYLNRHGNYPMYQELNKADNGKWSVNATPNVKETRNSDDELLQVILTPAIPGQTNFIII